MGARASLRGPVAFGGGGSHGGTGGIGLDVEQAAFAVVRLFGFGFGVDAVICFDLGIEGLIVFVVSFDCHRMVPFRAPCAHARY